MGRGLRQEVIRASWLYHLSTHGTEHTSPIMHLPLMTRYKFRLQFKFWAFGGKMSDCVVSKPLRMEEVASCYYSIVFLSEYPLV